VAHDERRLEVLRAIVQDYVSSNDPVGSKALAERHDLGVSPATIRNDMAVLEEQGYITQPHTSAGRVPTDKGYRLFVDRLSAVKPLSMAERRAIERFLDGAVDLHARAPWSSTRRSRAAPSATSRWSRSAADG
jgi:heat-inducible transcriptional repressor